MKTCPLCHKISLIAGNYSNRTRATKFNPTTTKRRQPNLQWVKQTSGKRIRICAKCLKRGLHLLLPRA